MSDLYCAHSPQRLLVLGTILKNPNDIDEDETTGFAIVEAKSTHNISLADALPQAILEVAALAKKHK